MAPATSLTEVSPGTRPIVRTTACAEVTFAACAEPKSLAMLPDRWGGHIGFHKSF